MRAAPLKPHRGTLGPVHQRTAATRLVIRARGVIGYLPTPAKVTGPEPDRGSIAYRYEIDPDRQLVIATFAGDASLADAAAFIAELQADPRHSPTMARIYDCRAVTRMPPVSELRAVAELFRRHVDPTTPVRRALVVKSGAYFGLGRMLQALVDLAGVDLNVFTDFGDAVDWLTGSPTR